MTTDEPAQQRRPLNTTGTIGLGTWFGIPARAHWSVLGTMTICTELVGSVVLPATRSSSGEMWTWVIAAGTAAALQGSILLHELAHSVTARRRGVRVHRITLWMLGGVTELAEDPPTPRGEALITLAGPAASLGIGIMCATASLLIDNPLLRAATGWLGALNVIIAVFNLLPGVPLDGGRIVFAIAWARTGDRHVALDRAVRSGRLLGDVLITIGLLSMIFAKSVDGVWIAVIGLFIRSTARSQGRADALSRLQGLVAGDAVVPAPEAAPEWWSVQQTLSWLGSDRASRQAIPLIDLSGRPVDLVTVAELLQVSPARRDMTRLRDLPRHTHAPVVRASTPLVDVVAGLSRAAPTAMVMDGDQLVGLVSTATLTRAALTEGRAPNVSAPTTLSRNP